VKHLTLILIVLTVLIAGWSQSADAATLFTSSIGTTGPADGGSAVCAITNVSSSELTATLTLINGSGDVIDSQSITIAPGTGESIQADVATGGYYCKFVVPNARRVRANLQILATELGVVFVRAISEAR
jgi:hypothetical protein